MLFRGIASQVTLHVARCLYGDMFRQVTETSYEKVTVQKAPKQEDLSLEDISNCSVHFVALRCTSKDSLNSLNSLS